MVDGGWWMTNDGGCAKIGDQSVLLHETIQDKLTTYSVRLPICVSWVFVTPESHVAKEVAKKETNSGRTLVQGVAKHLRCSIDDSVQF